MGEILRVAQAVARKAHYCRRCGKVIEKGKSHAVVVRRFKLQLRTDRAHYPECRPVDPDGALARGHFSEAVIQAVDQMAISYQTDRQKLPKWLEKNDWGDMHDWYTDCFWGEGPFCYEVDWALRLHEYERHMAREDSQHVYGHQESDE